MSLAQHVTQSQGFDYQSPTGVRDFQEPRRRSHDVERRPSAWRRLSYAPVDFAQDQRGPHRAAYKVSNLKRAAQVAVGVVACWLCSGIVFGFAALKPILIAEGVYRHLCPNDGNSEFFTNNHGDLSSQIPCKEQDMRLNLFFVLASTSGNTTCLVAGASLDRFGRRFCWILGSMLISTGLLLMGTSFAIPGFDGYIAANIILAFGGTYLFVSTFELANAFPKYSGLVVALVTGAFDASAAVFFFYRLAYEATDGRFSPEKFFYGYLIVPFLILVAEIWLMPANSYHTMPELDEKIEKAKDYTRDVHDSDDDIVDGGELIRVRSRRASIRQAKLDKIEGVTGDEECRLKRVKTEEDRQEASGAWGVLHGVPLDQQMRSPWYLLMLLLTSIQMFRMNYFIATLRNQYIFMLGSEASAKKINDFFDVALPVGGVAATPVIGVLLNDFSLATISASLTVFILAIGLFNCLPYAWAGYVTVVAFVLFRPLYYSAMSDYAAKVFGFETFGRIYGTIICIAGLTNFAQSGLDALTYGPLDGNPVPINIALGVSGGIVGISLTAYIYVNGRVFVKRQKAEIEADDERRRLLDGGGQGYGTSTQGV
ncbi:hypothetical protein ACO1O0_006573 [Amphichorda felina]